MRIWEKTGTSWRSEGLCKARRKKRMAFERAKQGKRFPPPVERSHLSTRANVPSRQKYPTQ